MGGKMLTTKQPVLTMLFLFLLYATVDGIADILFGGMA
jgi:hypothetical protein